MGSTTAHNDNSLTVTRKNSI